ncbi:MAG: hypothetical protein HFI33_15175 [Lachnospiraceae bacterium]|nr:hypothetical protein [Lachnospiraceae bacterium]
MAEEGLEAEDGPKVEGDLEAEDSSEAEEGEAEDSPKAEETPASPVCICTALCEAAAKAEEADCPVCREDLSACGGKDLTEQPEKVPDVFTETEEEDPTLPAGSQEPLGEEDLTGAGTETEETSDQEAAVAAVEKLLGGLPSLEELQALDQDGQAAVYGQIQEALEAYESLDEEQKALLPGVEEQLKELLDYITELSQPMAATEEQIKGAWDAMTRAMENWDVEVDVSSFNLTAGDMNRIWPEVAEDNPDLFYVLLMKTAVASDGIIQKCIFTYNIEYNQNNVAQYKAAIEKVFDQVIETNMTDEQKATALHDYLVQHMVYDQNANNNLGIEKRNAYEALVNGIGVCQGYTLAYAALLKRAGIEVDYCRSVSMNHIWNYVKLNGNWYHADLTFDDATASSQVGETGYVKHTYFLLSDAAMKNAKHAWEPNDITCDDTRYDNSWQKTAPISESAIYTVNGNYYYLKGETVDGAPQIIYRGATLIKRDTSGNETPVGTFEIEDLGSKWPMYPMSFSRLSCAKGTLYFNVGNSVYSLNPSANTVPVKIYQYEDPADRIVTGLLVTGDEMTLEIFNRTTNKIDERIKVPIFALSASLTRVKVGYTTAPVLSVNPLATGFTWSKQKSDGSWETINGATGSSYTVETGLLEGSYRYKVEATLDGKSVSSEIVITVTAQEEQKNFGFAGGDRKVTYGSPDFTMTAQGAEAGSVVRYSSSAPAVATVDPVTGAVKILKAGSTVITATASETQDYLEAKSAYTLTVSPKALSWDVSALEAKDRLDRIKNQAATLYGELKLAGILEKDRTAVRFECPAEKLAGVYQTVAAGNQKVTLSWKSDQDKGTLQGEGSGNYILPGALPEITGKISMLDSTLPMLPESTENTGFMVQVEYGLSEVPASFKDKEHLNTPGKIEQAMKVKLQEKTSGIADTNIVTYDVELLININGTGWQKATKDNFPSHGLTITLPYPSGTGKNSHDFVVVHMFTEDMNGFQAGDVEHPSVSKTDKGITFKVYGLSPISIGWKEVEKNNSSSGDGGASVTPSSTGNRVGSAATGDTSPILLYILLAVSAAFGMGIGLYMRRKSMHR